MQKVIENGVLGRILLALILISLLNLAPQPHAVANRFEQARRAMSFNTYPAVATVLSQIAEQLPWRVDLWEKAGFQALAGGDSIQAIVNFEHADKLGTLSMNGQVTLGDAYQLNGDLNAAIDVWTNVIRAEGTSTELLTRLAGAHWSVRDYASTIADLRAFFALHPDASAVSGVHFDEWSDRNFGQPNLSLQLGLLLAAEQPDSAPAYLIRASELNPELGSVARSLAREIQRALPEDNPAYTFMASGRALASLGLWEFAVHAFQGATEIQPNYSDAWAFLGEARQHLNASDEDLYGDELIPELKKALELNPNSVPGHIFTALYWQRNGQYDLALSALNTASQLDSNNPALHADLGATMASLGDLETAREYYQKAVEMTPGDPTYLRALAKFSLEYNYHVREIALPTARQALLSEPKDSASLDVMGQVLLVLEDYRGAEKFLRRALQYNPQYAPAHLHIGTLYLLRDDTDQARQHFSLARSLAIDPSTSNHAQRMWEQLFPP
ncbi:MAG: tetratricopeptide repeat protein [Anaerolineales bacterium]|jgi:tetratricopeptide (TPR) repeat protein